MLTDLPVPSNRSQDRLPILVKAAARWRKGMRVVNSEDQFRGITPLGSSEAKSAFGAAAFISRNISLARAIIESDPLRPTLETAFISGA